MCFQRPNNVITFGLLLLTVLLAIGWVLTWWRYDGFVRSSRLHFVDYHKRLDQIEKELDATQNKATLRALIVAVTDPDPEISKKADWILRRESGLKVGFGEIDRASDDERFRIMSKWCEWYLRERAGAD